MSAFNFVTLSDMLNYMKNNHVMGYAGMSASVYDDPDENNNGRYYLKDLVDPSNISDINSWIKEERVLNIQLTDINRLRILLKNSLDILIENKHIFEIFDDIGITREEFKELYFEGDTNV